jgi:hypothetical protein
MGDNLYSINEDRMERRFKLELARIQSIDSLKSNIAIGLYVLGATFMLGSSSPCLIFYQRLLASELA